MKHVITVKLWDVVLGKLNVVRKYEILDTGLPHETLPELHSGGVYDKGGLVCSDPDTHSYIGHFKDWPMFLSFLGNMRALVLKVEEIA